MIPVFYANDDGQGNYTGLVPITAIEVENTLALHASKNLDSSDFLSRIFYLLENDNATQFSA